jgi:acetyltransferase-like isoleucine patch superfamily enzyme
MLSRLLSSYKNHKIRKIWKMKNSNNKTSMGSIFDPDLVTVGRMTYGEINIINHSDNYRLKIGNFCSIAPEVLFVVCGDHALYHLSTYPLKVRYTSQKFEALSKGDIDVEDDVWIGTRATILSGVRIGRGAVICAGAVVVKDVQPYSIVAGVPAVEVKKRFSDEIIDELMKFDFNMINEDFVSKNLDALYEDIKTDEQVKELRNRR